MYQTERLLIRPLSYIELLKHIDNSENLAKELDLLPSKSLSSEETIQAIKNDLLPFLADSKNLAEFYTMWLIIEKSKKAIIGGLCFHGSPNENNEVEIGYGIDDDFRNNGYMTEAISGMIDWIKRYDNINTIIAETDDLNIPSIKVLLNNNFVKYQENNSIVYKLILK